MLILSDATPTTYNYGTELLNMFLTLGLVLGLAFVTVIFLRKMMRSKLRHLNRATGIKVLERRALNQKSSLYIVDVLGKGLVISESQTGGIQLISEFPPGTDLELLLAEEEAQLKQRTPLKESIQKNLSRLLKRDKAKHE